MNRLPSSPIESKIYAALEYFLDQAIQKDDTSTFNKLVQLLFKMRTLELARDRFEFTQAQAAKKAVAKEQSSKTSPTPKTTSQQSAAEEERAFREQVQAARYTLWGKEQADAAYQSIQEAEKRFMKYRSCPTPPASTSEDEASAESSPQNNFAPNAQNLSSAALYKMGTGVPAHSKIEDEY